MVIVNIIIGIIICWILVVLILYLFGTHVGSKATAIYSRSRYLKSLTLDQLKRLVETVISNGEFHANYGTNKEPISITFNLSDYELEEYHNNPKVFETRMANNLVFEADVMYHYLMHLTIRFDVISTLVHVMTLTVVSMRREIL